MEDRLDDVHRVRKVSSGRGMEPNTQESQQMQERRKEGTVGVGRKNGRSMRKKP